MDQIQSQHVTALERHFVFRVTPLSKFLALFLLVTLPFIGGFVGYQYGFTAGQQGASMRVVDDAIHSDPSRFRSNTLNVSFALPEGWTEVADLGSVAPPEGITDVTFAFTNAESCVIAAGKYPEDGYLIYRQVSFADSMTNATEDQYDGNWYVPYPSRITPEESEAQIGNPEFDVSNLRKPMEGEFRANGFQDGLGLILWNSTGGTVPESCNDDMNALLQSIASYYEPVTLDPSSVGRLAIGSARFAAMGSWTAKSLLLLTEPSGETRMISELPADLESVFIYDQKMYGALNTRGADDTVVSSAIYVVDPFAGTQQDVEGTRRDGVEIVSLYGQGDSLYTFEMASENEASCDSLRDYCTSDLYKTSLKTGTRELLAKDMKSGWITGVETATGAVYVVNGYGDAGCGWSKTRRILGSTEEMVDEFSGCSDDPGVKDRPNPFVVYSPNTFGFANVANGSTQYEAGDPYSEENSKYSYGFTFIR